MMRRRKKKEENNRYYNDEDDLYEDYSQDKNTSHYSNNLHRNRNCILFNAGASMLLYRYRRATITSAGSELMRSRLE